MGKRSQPKTMKESVFTFLMEAEDLINDIANGNSWSAEELSNLEYSAVYVDSTSSYDDSFSGEVDTETSATSLSHDGRDFRYGTAEAPPRLETSNSSTSCYSLDIEDKFCEDTDDTHEDCFENSIDSAAILSTALSESDDAKDSPENSTMDPNISWVSVLHTNYDPKHNLVNASKEASEDSKKGNNYGVENDIAAIDRVLNRMKKSKDEINAEEEYTGDDRDQQESREGKRSSVNLLDESFTDGLGGAAEQEKVSSKRSGSNNSSLRSKVAGIVKLSSDQSTKNAGNESFRKSKVNHSGSESSVRSSRCPENKSLEASEDGSNFLVGDKHTHTYESKEILIRKKRSNPRKTKMVLFEPENALNPDLAIMSMKSEDEDVEPTVAKTNKLKRTKTCVFPVFTGQRDDVASYVGHLVRAMAKYGHSKTVQMKALKAISRIAVYEQFRPIIWEAGTVDKVLSSIYRHSDNPRVIDSALGALMNLAIDDDIKENITDIESPKLTLTAMAVFRDDVRLQRNALGFVRNMSHKNLKFQSDFVANDGLNIINKVLEQHENDQTVQENGMATLLNMTIESANGVAAKMLGDRRAKMNYSKSVQSDKKALLSRHQLRTKRCFQRLSGPGPRFQSTGVEKKSIDIEDEKAKYSDMNSSEIALDETSKKESFTEETFSDENVDKIENMETESVEKKSEEEKSDESIDSESNNKAHVKELSSHKISKSLAEAQEGKKNSLKKMAVEKTVVAYGLPKVDGGNRNLRNKSPNKSLMKLLFKTKEKKERKLENIHRENDAQKPIIFEVKKTLKAMDSNFEEKKTVSQDSKQIMRQKASLNNMTNFVNSNSFSTNDSRKIDEDEDCGSYMSIANYSSDDAAPHETEIDELAQSSENDVYMAVNNKDIDLSNPFEPIDEITGTNSTYDAIDAVNSSYTERTEMTSIDERSLFFDQRDTFDDNRSESTFGSTNGGYDGTAAGTTTQYENPIWFWTSTVSTMQQKETAERENMDRMSNPPEDERENLKEETRDESQNFDNSELGEFIEVEWSPCTKVSGLYDGKLSIGTNNNPSLSSKDTPCVTSIDKPKVQPSVLPRSKRSYESKRANVLRKTSPMRNAAKRSELHGTLSKNGKNSNKKTGLNKGSKKDPPNKKTVQNYQYETLSSRKNCVSSKYTTSPSRSQNNGSPSNRMRRNNTLGIHERHPTVKKTNQSKEGLLNKKVMKKDTVFMQTRIGKDMNKNNRVVSPQPWGGLKVTGKKF
uniref:Armadillo repeat-containing domain-containing protein n=1 Tax=Corethron hystrix TaxID=216773 RepID=A0A7S1C178_9STRA|mmetsp:Transcript_8524/g.18768  ORF Transcript_8524/g.18768 Transcript_8524/m.18768 type:complete len:1241 (+) Transcript_8524:348-4070(+)